MQFIFFVVGVIVLAFNDYTYDWSSILFPLIVGILLIATSLYSTTKKEYDLNVDFNTVWKHLVLLVTTLMVLGVTNIYISTIWYIMFYSIVDKAITFTKQIFIIILLGTIQYILKTFLYFNI